MPDSRVFSCYLRLWSVTNLLRISIGLNAGTGLVGSTLDAGSKLNLVVLPLIILAADLAPAKFSGALPCMAMVLRALTNIAKGAMMSNSQMWATQMDIALLLALAMRRRVSKASWLAPLSADDESEIVGACAKTIRWQLAIFYFASGFWKVNSSFLHPQYSCASLFTVQPLEYLPDEILFAPEGSLLASLIPATARLIAQIGPASTLVIEAIVPALHALAPASWPKCAAVGVASTLVFHLVIGLTPPPSNVSTYGVTTCTRLFFVMPTHVTTALDGVLGGTRDGLLLAGALALAAAASLALVAPLHAVAVSTVQGEGVDWHLAWYAMLCVLFAKGLYLEAMGGMPEATKPKAKAKAPPRPDTVTEGSASRPLIATALIYAFVLPLLGLQEKAGCLMFSQLRLHGGSNHYLLPTSLLQRYYVDAPPSSAFAGGVVRVESTSLEWVGNTFAEHMTERTRKVIRELADVPGEYVWAAKATSKPRATPPPRFRKHTLSNLGLRRLLATASAQKDVFTLQYTRLEGAVGDEAWRTTSSGTQYVIKGDASGQLMCAKVGLGGLAMGACSEREAALVLTPPDAATSLLAWFLVPQPNPIVPGLTDEMHCVTWG